jgi:hypothetical protein
MRVYLSEMADSRLVEYLRETGYTVVPVENEVQLGFGVGAHADLHMCKVGNKVIKAEKSDFSPEYPQNAAFCAVCLDRYIIHKLSITSPKILESVKNLTPINVRQGYTRCSSVVVDGSSVITSDEGIFKALSNLEDVDVLKVQGGGVLLPGFDTGFIGGCSGRVGNELIFNGNLEKHPDFERIRNFVTSKNVKLKYFTDYELCDIGSILEAEN